MPDAPRSISLVRAHWAIFAAMQSFVFVIFIVTFGYLASSLPIENTARLHTFELIGSAAGVQSFAMYYRWRVLFRL